jgi:O-acetyl-ADP-ribose deacetylase (regulator of RNase III)
VIKTVKGDILKFTEDAAGHGCNCKRTMGSGVAKALRAKWPQVYQTDLDYVECAGKKKIGKFSRANVGENKKVYNIYTQVEFLPRGIDHFEYDGFKEGLSAVCDNMLKDGLKSLALPKIGAGLAGGNWSKIKKIIEEVSEEKGIDITIYEL